MTTDEKYMQRCLQLANNGLGNVAPNPMVGSVIVHNDCIIGESFHREYGKAHAEPNAINSVKDEALLSNATLYVNLEPCSHYGKTPPCSALIIEKKIPRVVIGSLDPNPKVAGRGVKMMQDAGVEVVFGIMDAENRTLNKRFFTFFEKKRPYIILKWAQSIDGFMDGDRKENDLPTKFSTPVTQLRNHKTRAEEMSIMVGTNTALKDDPQLTTRLWAGKDPLRITIDKDDKIPTTHKLKDGVARTIIYTEGKKEGSTNLTYVSIDFKKNILEQILSDLYSRDINSVIIEGGSTLLQSFIDKNFWDEARIETAFFKLKAGVKSPEISMSYYEEEFELDGNKFMIFRNE